MKTDKNKAMAPALSGAIMAIVVNFYPDMFNTEALLGITTILSMAFVWFARNY